jgi:hypothetical protein
LIRINAGGSVPGLVAAIVKRNAWRMMMPYLFTISVSAVTNFVAGRSGYQKQCARRGEI